MYAAAWLYEYKSHNRSYDSEPLPSRAFRILDFERQSKQLHRSLATWQKRIAGEYWCCAPHGPERELARQGVWIFEPLMPVESYATSDSMIRIFLRHTVVGKIMFELWTVTEIRQFRCKIYICANWYLIDWGVVENKSAIPTWYVKTRINFLMQTCQKILVLGSPIDILKFNPDLRDEIPTLFLWINIKTSSIYKHFIVTVLWVLLATLWLFYGKWVMYASCD